MNSIISFFSGAGFLDLGFEHAGFRVDLVNEFNAEFLVGYRHSRKKLGSPLPRYGHHLGSIEDFLVGEKRELLARVMDDIRRTDRKIGFVGGPPCPDFSVAGKNAGGDGDNGRLTSVYFELVRLMKPDFFIFENVEGLWRTKIHREYYDQQKALVSDSGYILHDRLTSSINYGVGQHRKRIFLFGCLGEDKGVEFPFEETMSHSENVLDIPWPKLSPYEQGSVIDIPAGLPQELTVQHWFNKNAVNEHPNGSMWFNARSKRIHEISEGDVHRKSFKRLHRWRYSPTAAYGNNEVHLHPYEPRRISVAEALAIQSLPAEYELPDDMPLTTCFKTIGNGVPYLAAVGLAESVRLYLDRYESSVFDLSEVGEND